MRHVPREPDASVNVSDEHPLSEAATLTVGLSLIFIVIAALLVFMVDAAVYLLPAEREAELFESWLPEDIETVSDDERLATVVAITDRLAARYPESPYTFRVQIDASPTSNAMAFPGGLIIVTAGLLDDVETENELAFVLAHEIGHFHNRDHLRSMGRGLVLSLLLVSLGVGDSANFGASIANLTLRSFSREQETDADEFALRLVYEEYGHVADADRFFERILAEHGDTTALVEYASTHPSSAERIDHLAELAAENGWPTTGTLTTVEWRR